MISVMRDTWGGSCGELKQGKCVGGVMRGYGQKVQENTSYIFS
jgi:hypothetical protein